MAHRIVVEARVEDRIKGVLERFVGQRFNDITITVVERQYKVDDRWADIAVLKDDGLPILLIETKKKYERGGWRVERRFIPTSEDVVGQVVAYAAILKRRGIYVPFVATANESQLALFKIPENIEQLVDWRAVEERDYSRVLKNFYEFRHSNLVFHRPHRFSEEFFKELLETVTGVYAKKFGVEERRQELHWALIEDFRGFVDFLAPFIQEAIAPGGRFRDDIARLVEEHSRRTGYTPTPEGLAREMAYVLLNKIVFYKVLERYYKLPRLEPLYERGLVHSCHAYLTRLRELFDKAVEVSKDFETIFRTGVYDAVDVIESEEVLKTLDWLVRLIDHYKVEKLGDIIGFIYEDLIPGEERHRLGQFYTPRPIAELIVKWAVRSPDDKVLDPGCGSGTFLVEAYKRLAELKLKRPFSEIKHVPGDAHKQILGQLYAIDINEFPAHLTAINLSMKNVRVPSPTLNIFVRDYFTIRPGFKELAPYKAKTPEGEKEIEVVFKDFDAVVGNPPYTRWTEIPDSTQNRILEILKSTISKYGLTPQVARGVEPGIYVYWIMHSTGFLKEGGRLSMIISDSWLQTDYGMNFFRFLLDNYKVHAIIDVSARVFPVPLIGACIVLLEKCSNTEERNGNKVVFMYLDISKGMMDINETLKLIEEAKSIATPGQLLLKEFPSGSRALVKVYTQGELLKYEEKVINLIFGASDILNYLKRNPLIVELSKYFEPSYGNILYLYLASIGKIRGVRNVGGNEFFYLTEGRARELGILQEYLHPLIPSSRYLRYFTFTKEDWEGLRRGGVECYLFLCHKPRSELPETVRRYIQLGEGPNAQIRLRRRPGEPEGRPVSESQAAQTRLRYRNLFFDWYDLGGVVEIPIIASRYAQYWHRFALSIYKVACDDDIMALVPRQGVSLNVEELKALLAYLNSSFTKLYLETNGRSTGGGALALEAGVLNDMLILDVNKLPREDVEKLARMFDRLESEARRFGGADVVENVFGSELAKELTGSSDVRPGIEGLFNTVIREIDYEIASILGLEHLVETIRTMMLELVRRRLSRAGEARREAIVGEEREAEPRGRRARRRAGGEGGSRVVRRLNEFLQGS
jgi:type I restriction-modification system DNA methylase subunit